ncbi:hypothetical protein Bca52824_069168 [Brassica carinata]|uniref:Uncharacterized protein n=1 Tax=Brassica carinata TaxID=52824 RepID=A0A8X7Q6R3_BRACI|nr:hypothetical protein Bca52824_069168 [Brassica carinata]
MAKSECGHNPVRFFATLSIQRSGSGWFETLLNSHDNVPSSSDDGKPHRSWKLASLFAETAAAEMKRFRRNPRRRETSIEKMVLK